MKNRSENIGIGEIIIYQPSKKEIEINVRLEQESVWLPLNQIAVLFDTDKSGISRHLSNIYKNGELGQKSTVAKIATVQKEGERTVKRWVEHYNLDAILSVGYRVNSKRATQFRIWATNTLRQYLVKGYALNQRRLSEASGKFHELQTAIAFLQEKSQKKLLEGQEREILNLLSDYAKTLLLLEQYDKGKLTTPKGQKPKYVLRYDDCQKIVGKIKKELIRKKEAGGVFGQERDKTFEGILCNLYQTFGGKELYPSLEEKAAHLLYFIIKDHPFVDGNKRIGSFLFIYFLDKNNYLCRQTGERKINDNALTALALLIADSNPKDKEILTKIILNLMSD
jgi:prophage maintenance system killer protein